MTDYTYLTDRIVNAMREQNEALNTKQEAILAGSLSSLQMLIEAFGLKETIKRLKEIDKNA